MFLAIFLFFLSLSTRVAPSTLQPWEITNLYTYTPNGWPGSSPYANFFASITNPNTIPLPPTRWGNVSFPSTTANCTAKWIDFINESPFDKIIPCEPYFGEGKWMMEIQRANVSGYGPSATRDFTLQFKMEESMVLNDGMVRLNFVGRMGFSLDENLMINCAASGFCRTWLDGTKSPQLVVPVVEVECLSGVCDSFHL